MTVGPGPLELMSALLDRPLMLLVVTFLAFWAAAWVGGKARAARAIWEEKNDQDFVFVLGATLTLLGLLLGFSFSMAVGRYDQRKNLEEEEANAIGTAYVRADLLPASDAETVRGLLRSYLDQRILFYTSSGGEDLRLIDARTAPLQAQMWAVVAKHASANPTQVAALVVQGMNDVLNSQGYSQAAWLNRIPPSAWLLLLAISIFCNVLIGYGAHGRSALVHTMLPVALSITLFLIADIEGPRRGVIRVLPLNLLTLAESLRPL